MFKVSVFKVNKYSESRLEVTFNGKTFENIDLAHDYISQYFKTTRAVDKYQFVVFKDEDIHSLVNKSGILWQK